MLKHYFNPKNGTLFYENPSVFLADIKALPECRHVMEIKKYSDKRTKGANAYYWAVVIDYFMKEMGIENSKSGQEYMHYTVLADELRREPDPLRPGKTRIIPTSTMTGSEFWKYIKQCEYLFNSQFNGSFPPPKSLGYDETKR